MFLSSSTLFFLFFLFLFLSAFITMVGTESTVRYIGEWGHFGPQAKNIAVYHLAPMQQKAFYGYFKHGLPNTVRRVTTLLLAAGPGLIFFFGTYKWALQANHQAKRKDPSHFGGDAAPAVGGHH